MRLSPSIRLKVALACGIGIAGAFPCRAADADEIVRRAAAALKSDWAADPLYASTEREEIQKGGKISSKTFEVVMVDGSDYRLSVANDDQLLPPARRQSELMKFRQEIERRANESAPARRSRIEAWKKRRDEDGELLLDFPTALDFQMVGEETRDGHPAYVFTGRPKPGLTPTTRAQKVLAGIQGKAWVEKETLHPIHVECTVVRSVPVFGPLASVLPGTEIEIGMTRVAESVWLIDVVSMRLNISKLHMLKSTDVTRTTYTRYRLNSEAVAQLLGEANRP